MTKIINLYTDGSSLGNPGPSGWGYIIEYGGHREVDAGAFELSTNNRMEIMAVIRGLGRIKNRSIPVIVHCDAKYVVKGVNEWRKTWEDRGWKNSRGKLVKNCDLWATLFTLVDQFERIKFVWVKAHNGNEWNEWADELAREGAEYAKEHV